MRVDAQVRERDPGVARARMFGAMVAGVLLMAGCGMVCAGLMLDMVTAWPAFKVSLSYSSS